MIEGVVADGPMKGAASAWGIPGDRPCGIINAQNGELATCVSREPSPLRQVRRLNFGKGLSHNNPVRPWAERGFKCLTSLDRWPGNTEFTTVAEIALPLWQFLCVDGIVPFAGHSRRM